MISKKVVSFFFFFQAEDGIRDLTVTGVQTCALPICGCGTALVAAQKLKRQWIGIDVSPTACRAMAKRLKKDCGLKEDEKLWEIGRGFIVRDLPKTEAELRKYPAFEFENWAVVALGGIPNKVQVGDLGIDGRIYPVSAIPE